MKLRCFMVNPPDQEISYHIVNWGVCCASQEKQPAEGRFGVKSRNTLIERKISGLPSKADLADNRAEFF